VELKTGVFTAPLVKFTAPLVKSAAPLVKSARPLVKSARPLVKFAVNAEKPAKRIFQQYFTANRPQGGEAASVQ
jgi:hypothetical protein